MKKYLVDANLPSKIKPWQSDEFEFVISIDDSWTDGQIWDYAKKNDLTIISKDADFSHRIIVSNPPPRIIHIKLGNMKLRTLDLEIQERWTTIKRMSKTRKLVNVFSDRIEAVE